MYIIANPRIAKNYIGYTDDLRRRLKEHQERRSKYTKSKGNWLLIYYEAYRSKADALRREKQLKKFKKSYAMLKSRIKESLQTVA